ncbi:MAG TPA: TadE family protein [Sphingobium sp.]|nr:TadE family protein [Sphingobium sp.]
MMRRLAPLRRLLRHASGVAAVEFALTAPIILTMFLGGAELTNFAITRMRVSQIALHVADNASRIGANSLLTAPQISEMQINDLFLGANLQAGTLDLKTRGRVILSSFEAVASPNPSRKFHIRWQRCYGDKPWLSQYGKAGDTQLSNIGPTGQKVTAPDDTAVMFVEVAYDYKPLIAGRFMGSTMIHDIAAMTVRDQRDYEGPDTKGIYNVESVTPSSCIQPTP